MTVVEDDLFGGPAASDLGGGYDSGEGEEEGRGAAMKMRGMARSFCTREVRISAAGLRG